MCIDSVSAFSLTLFLPSSFPNFAECVYLISLVYNMVSVCRLSCHRVRSWKYMRMNSHFQRQTVKGNANTVTMKLITMNENLIYFCHIIRVRLKWITSKINSSPLFRLPFFPFYRSHSPSLSVLHLVFVFVAGRSIVLSIYRACQFCPLSPNVLENKLSRKKTSGKKIEIKANDNREKAQPITGSAPHTIMVPYPYSTVCLHVRIMKMIYLYDRQLYVFMR